jgi:hypothetical protein
MSSFRVYFSRMLLIRIALATMAPIRSFGGVRTSNMKLEQKRQASIYGMVSAVFAHRFFIENGQCDAALN